MPSGGQGCGGGGRGRGQNRGRWGRGRGAGRAELSETQTGASCSSAPPIQSGETPRGPNALPKDHADELVQLRQRAQTLEQQLNEARFRLSDGPTVVQRRVAVVNRDSCTICGICASSCPRDAIRVNDLVEVDVSRCSGCGACVDVCPSSAIQLENL